MRFGGFNWDEGNRDKCGIHGVSIAEIESVFAGAPLIGPDPAHSTVETRFRAIGQTAGGRYVFLVFTWREQRIRPISARYMHAKEIDHYGQATQSVPGPE